MIAWRNGALYCEQVPLEEIAGSEGTPCYVYSSAAILERFRAYDRAFGSAAHTVCYAVKANSNLAILAMLAQEGAGFDIVSGGELYRVLKAGGDPSKTVFSGVGKTAPEIEFALRSGIHSFNTESEPELELIDSLADRLGARARIALRVNPNVDASTHPYISTGLREHKFGIDIAEVEDVYQRARACKHLDLEGVSCHIGSQILDVDPVMQAVETMTNLVQRLRKAGFPIRTLDLGGGLGISYKPGQQTPDITAFIGEICSRTAGLDVQLFIEPGRSVVGEAGVMLSRVLYRKNNGEKEFVIVDAGMNDLIRPSLYHSHHEILPVRQRDGREIVADVVGPVCETGDFLARGRTMPEVMPGDVLAVCTAGAYGFVIASNYNSRTRPPEILVEGDRWRVIRERETFEDLVRGESPLPA